MKVTEIEYEGLILTVRGDLIKEEPENNINEGFEAFDIRDNLNNDLFGDYDEDELQEIEAICFDKVKQNNQSNWETANV